VSLTGLDWLLKYLCADLRDGLARTSSLTGTGLGMRIDEIPGFDDAIREGDKAFRAARPEVRRV
jgi:hypothetical protein